MGKSKEEMMADIRARFWESKIRNRDNRLSPMWLLRCLAPLLLLALGCIPAAAQCDLYVAEYKSTNVDVYNTFTDQLVAAIPVQLQPLAVAITPHGAFAYVSNQISGNLSVIDTASNTVVDSRQGAPMLSEGVAITRRRDALTSRCR